MTERADTGDAHDEGFLAPDPDSKPVDHCYRCGVETPPGQGLCDEHNPRRLSGPSPTQMHATIFGGIVIGVLGFFLIARLAVGTSGPYVAEVTGTATGPDGGVVLSYAVTNEGEDEGIADCRVTRDGVPRPDDLAFRTTAVPGGETATFERELGSPPAGSVVYDLETLSLICT